MMKVLLSMPGRRLQVEVVHQSNIAQRPASVARRGGGRGGPAWLTARSPDSTGKLLFLVIVVILRGFWRGPWRRRRRGYCDGG